QSRVRFAEKHLRCRSGNPWCVRGYQVASLESRATRKVHCSGRDVGKTTEIEILCAWASVCQPGRQMLVATQHEAHLAPLMRRILSMFERNPRLRGNLDRVRQSPAWQIEFKNGFQLFGRIAGVGGVNFQGLHVDWQLIDEAQNMTDEAWNQLYPALNTGGYRWIYGVPNGLRNQFYRLSRNPKYEQYHWPSRLNPDYTEEKDREMIYLYGGRESPGYVHNVLGLHGSPERSVFNLNAFTSCVAEMPHFDCQVARPDDLPDIEPILRDLDLPKNAKLYLGADLGFAQDPSELVIFAKVDAVGSSSCSTAASNSEAAGTNAVGSSSCSTEKPACAANTSARSRGSATPPLINLGRVHMRNVDYAAQQKVIETLDNLIDFDAIGIDNGHSGIAVAHNLMSISEIWAHKVVPVPFGGAVEWDGGWDVPRIRRFVKELMTEMLIRLINAGEVRFPPIPERFNQYAGHTYSQAPSGRIVYTKGNDHIIDADRCAIMAINRHILYPMEELPVYLPLRVEFF
ncbi:MAG: hypothetical protein NTZ09_01725, partial [Candidatus Hydrogenedentes bacterium]|nr:hypothetical protein [Candidatus Hydrogenedentota bacterium]